MKPELWIVLEGLVQDFKNGHFKTSREEAYANIKDSPYYVISRCILSSGWSFERADAAAQYITQNIEGTRGYGSVESEDVESMLRGENIRHRFPRSRGVQLAKSLNRMSNDINIYRDYQKGSPNDNYLRQYLVKYYPGLGLKQASMFMRDYGLSDEVAIVDAHIVWFVKHQIGPIELKTPKTYIRIEHYLKSVAADFGVSLGALDSLIWCMVRQYKQIKVRQKCEEQYALRLGD